MPSIRATTSGSSALPPAATRLTDVDERVDIADALLQQIADTLGSSPIRSEQPLVAELRQHENAGLRPLPAQLQGGAQAVIGAVRRHLDVDDDRIGSVSERPPQK